MKRYLGVLVSIVLVLLMISLIVSMFSYFFAVKRAGQVREEALSRMREAEFQDRARASAIGKEQETLKNISVVINESVKFKDIILIEVSFTNASQQEAYLNLFSHKLKDKNMMQCWEVASPNDADFPFTETQRKGFLFQQYSSTLLPGEGIKGYYCFRCPDSQVNEYTLIIIGKQMHITPRVITPGLNLDVVVNENARYDDLVFVDVSLRNISQANEYYSSEFFTLTDGKGATCRRAETNTVYLNYFPLTQVSRNDKLDSKYGVIVPGSISRGYICFSCSDKEISEFVLTVAPQNKKMPIHIAPPLSSEKATGKVDSDVAPFHGRADPIQE